MPGKTDSLKACNFTELGDGDQPMAVLVGQCRVQAGQQLSGKQAIALAIDVRGMFGSLCRSIAAIMYLALNNCQCLDARGVKVR